MKRRFEIVVTLKDGLLDPQGKAVESSLPTMGWKGVSNIRVGKHIELTVEAADDESARGLVEEIAKRLLSNPVIEDYRVLTGGSGGSSSPGDEEAAAQSASGPPGRMEDA
ncbi:MAG: phosphoribosylformylglycinamidine synthase subunit PurS [Actinomycetota bacterium]